MTDIWGVSPRAAVRRSAFLPSPIFLLIVAAFAGSGWGLWSGMLPAKPWGVFPFVLSGWLLSLCLHEYAHAVVAYRSGDHTIAEAGYLTLNPLKYTHAVLSIALPVLFLLIGGIGLPGGAVYVNHSLVRSRVRESLIAFAGPLTNVVFALAVLVPTALLWDGSEERLPFFAGMAFLGLLQVTAAILNFLPVPGLDGFGIIEPWLSAEDKATAAKIGPFGMIAVFALLFVDQLNEAFFHAIYVLMDALGVDPGLSDYGHHWFQFWSGTS